MGVGGGPARLMTRRRATGERAMHRLLAGRLYYGWIVVGVTCLTLLVAGGIRSAPAAVFILPIEADLGWDKATIAFAVSLGLLLYGLVGPLAGRWIDRFGARVVMMISMALTGVSMLISAVMTELWQLNLFWGVLAGLATGLASAVLGPPIANRWFVARRGLVTGIFGGAMSAGQLIFIPGLMALTLAIGWRQASFILALIALAMLTPIALLMRNDPADLGLQPYGGPAPQPAGANPSGGVMASALRTPEFWLLAGSFFVCGATSMGLIGVHFIPHSVDHGIPEVKAAGVLALMGALNFVGTVGSGWLTDRFDPRKLLACYYSFRGLSLLLLPFLITTDIGLVGWAVLFGLDYIATVPPTATLVADLFGRRNVGQVFGWVFFAHQVGAALASYLSGLARVHLGDYGLAFLVAGLLAMLGGLMALRIGRHAPAPVQVATAR
jgi:sugar phosphate permease